MIVVTRADPPLRLARMRAAGTLAELRSRRRLHCRGGVRAAHRRRSRAARKGRRRGARPADRRLACRVRAGRARPADGRGPGFGGTGLRGYHPAPWPPISAMVPSPRSMRIGARSCTRSRCSGKSTGRAVRRGALPHRFGCPDRGPGSVEPVRPGLERGGRVLDRFHVRRVRPRAARLVRPHAGGNDPPACGLVAARPVPAGAGGHACGRGRGPRSCRATARRVPPAAAEERRIRGDVPGLGPDAAR